MPKVWAIEISFRQMPRACCFRLQHRPATAHDTTWKLLFAPMQQIVQEPKGCLEFAKQPRGRAGEDGSFLQKPSGQRQPIIVDNVLDCANTANS